MIMHYLLNTELYIYNKWEICKHFEDPHLFMKHFYVILVKYIDDLF